MRIAGFAACSPKHLAPRRHREQCSTCQAEFAWLISPSITRSSHSISIISIIFQLQRKLRQFYSWRDLFPATPPVTTGAFFTSFVRTELRFQRGPAKRPEKKSNDVLVDVICHMTTESTSGSRLFVLLSLLHLIWIISTVSVSFCHKISVPTSSNYSWRGLNLWLSPVQILQYSKLHFQGLDQKKILS